MRSLALIIIVMILSPVWGLQTRSMIEWAAIEKPARCFQLDSFTIFGWTTSACSDWRHCDLNNDKNLAKGYSCLTTQRTGIATWNLVSNEEDGKPLVFSGPSITRTVPAANCKTKEARQ